MNILSQNFTHYNPHFSITLRGPPMEAMLFIIHLCYIEQEHTMEKYLQEFQEILAFRNYSPNTIKAYICYLRAYLDYLQNVLGKMPEEASWQEQRDFIVWLQQTRCISDRTVNGVISQLRCFTIYVLHKPWDDFQLPKKKFQPPLPYVPSQEEVWYFLSAVPDLKYRTMFTLIYSAGLRASEVYRLKYEDISREKMRIHIRHGKNHFSRYTVLSQQALELLTHYWRVYGRPMGYLFPTSANAEKPIHPTRLSEYIRIHADEMKLPHHLTCHSLRHAFGTHLYENGVDLLTIKNLLGHRSLNSTTIYVHLAFNGRQIESPLDRMAQRHHE